MTNNPWTRLQQDGFVESRKLTDRVTVFIYKYRVENNKPRYVIYLTDETGGRTHLGPQDLNLDRFHTIKEARLWVEKNDDLIKTFCTLIDKLGNLCVKMAQRM